MRVCVCFFTNNICTSGFKLACPRHVACSLCVCAGFGFHFVYAVVCLCACSDMVMHVGLSHFGCHVFFYHTCTPTPTTASQLLAAAAFSATCACTWSMVFAMNEPLQAGSLCRLSQSLEQAVLEIHHVGLIQAWFLCFTEARLKHLGLVFPFRKVHIHHTPWFFF